MKLKTLALAIITFFTMTLSKPSHANLSLAYGSFKGVMLGLAIMGVTTATGYGGVKLIQKKNVALKILGGAIVVVSAFGILFGAMGLDGEDGQSASFQPLSEEQAAKLNISESERLSYNSEVDQINFLAADMSAALSVDADATAEDAAALWQENRRYLSEETFSALQKIATQVQLN